jgi:hypothetical protein
MRTTPALATAILERLVPANESLVGDLIEEYRRGRSRAWYWRQVTAAVVLGGLRQAGARPARTMIGVATGWIVLLLAFFALGDKTSEALAKWLWSWDRHTAYATGVWAPFQIVAAVVSYAGFALSALAVARLHRRDAGSLLIAYAASLVLVLTAGGAIVDMLGRRPGGVAVPHTLFYVVSITLPYHWRSGTVLAPLLVLVVGAMSVIPLQTCLPWGRARAR